MAPESLTAELEVDDNNNEEEQEDWDRDEAIVEACESTKPSLVLVKAQVCSDEIRITVFLSSFSPPRYMRAVRRSSTSSIAVAPPRRERTTVSALRRSLLASVELLVVVIPNVAG